MERTVCRVKNWQRRAPLFFFTLFLCLLGLSGKGMAAPLEKVPTVLTQPDGGTVRCYSSGDEHFNYLHDAGGALIVQDEEGWYTYAVNRDGYPAASDERVRESGAAYRSARGNARMTVDDVDLEAHPELAAQFDQEQVPFFKREETAVYSLQSQDRLANVVVFLRFQGEEEFVSGTVRQPVSQTADQTGGGQLDFYEHYEQVRSYFDKVSDGSLETDTIFLTDDKTGREIISYEDDHSRAYYKIKSASNPEGYSGTDNDKERTQREMELLENALRAVLPSLPEDARLDYNGDGLIDNITFIVSGTTGGWNQILWPHSWSLFRNEIKVVDASGEEKSAYRYNLNFSSPNYAGVGVLSHELLHTVGFPDLYRYTGKALPVGEWDVMGTTNYSDPQFLGSYLANAYAGWGILADADASGVYTLRPLGTDDGSPDGYRIPTGNPNEYLVAEYRKNGKAGDVTQDNVPRDGLLLYRANRVTSAGNRNGTAAGGDEVYVFRPGDADVNAATPTQLSKASLSDRWSYTALGSADPSTAAKETLYLNGGANSRVVVSEVRENADGTISFRVTLPEEENRVEPGEYDLSARDYTVSAPGEYRFTGSTDAHSVTVSAGTKDVTLILNHVEVDLSGTEYGAPVYVRGGAQVRLVLEGQNRLAGGRYETAVHIGESAAVTLSGSGSLEAFGGGGAAAIGGNAFAPTGSLIVSGVMLTAHGGRNDTVVGTSAELTVEAAPALGAGAGQRAGDIRLENAELELFAGPVYRKTGDGGEEIFSNSGLAASTCGKNGENGGAITAAGCTVWGDGSLRAGDVLSCTDCRLTLARTTAVEFGCLEAEGTILLNGCETDLNGGPKGSAIGGGNKAAELSVSGGSLRAVSAGYTVCASSAAFDNTVSVFLGSGETETLFSGYASEEFREPLRVQPGMPAGAAGRTALLQGTLEAPLTVENRFRLYQEEKPAGSFSVPVGVRTFAVSLPSGGSYRLRSAGGEESGTVSAADEGISRAALEFARKEALLPELDLSAGPVVIRESGGYILRGVGSTVTVENGLEATLYLRGVDLTAPAGHAALVSGQNSKLVLISENGENKVSGGTGSPAVEATGTLALEGDGGLLLLGGAGAPAVSARSMTVERDCRVLAASSEAEAVALASGGENVWNSEWGETPILLAGSLQTPLNGAAELVFRGAGAAEAWTVPSGTGSIWKTVSKAGEQIISANILALSGPLSCREGLNVYESIVLERVAAPTRKLDLSKGDAVISEDGVYSVSGATDCHMVRVADHVTAMIRLDGVEIDAARSSVLSGRRGLVELGENDYVVLMTGSDSSLVNRMEDSSCALVYVPGTSRLVMQGGGMLTAVPGGAAPLFGTPDGEDCGGIVLESGMVSCTVPEGSTSGTLVGGENARVTMTGGNLNVSGENSGSVGGPNSRVSVTGGSLSVEGGSASGTLGGENSLVEITGGTVALSVQYGETGIGGPSAVVNVTGGSVWISDVETLNGGMRAALGGPRSRLELIGGEILIDAFHTGEPGWGALGGAGAKAVLGKNVQAAVRMKQRSNTPLAAEDMLDERTPGGFLEVRLANVFDAETTLEFPALDSETGEAGGLLRGLSLPKNYYGFFVYLPVGPCGMESPSGSAGAAMIRQGIATSLKDVEFNRIPGLWFGSETVPYDKQPHTLTLSGTLPEEAEVLYEGGGQTLPGSYPMSAEITYQGKSYRLAADLTITKAALNVTGVSARDKAVYDGTCATTGSFSLNGAKGGDSPAVTADFLFETPDVGRDKAVRIENLRLDPAWEELYELTVRDGALDHVTASVLTPAPAAVTIDEGSLLQGAGESRSVTVATSPAGLPVRVTYDGAEELPRQAGSYAVEAAVGGNYTGGASGTLVLAETLDLSQGDAVISAPGGYVVTGDSESSRIIVQGQALEGDVALALQNVSIGRTEPGKAPLTVENGAGKPGRLTLVLPAGTESVLRAGAGAPALSCGDTALTLSGSGRLLAYGGEGAEAVELAGVLAVSPAVDCQLYSTLERQTAALPQTEWTFLSFAAPAEMELGLTLSTGSGQTRALPLDSGYRSLFVSRRSGEACTVRNEAGEKLLYLASGARSGTDIPFRGQNAAEQTIDLTGRKSVVHIVGDGIYRLTGRGTEKTVVLLKQGVEATLILDGVQLDQARDTLVPFLVGEGGNRVTVVCEEDSRLRIDRSGFCELHSGGTLGLEGKGTLTVTGENCTLFRAGRLTLAGRLETAAGADATVFDGGTVELQSGAELEVSGAGTNAAVFGPDSTLAASGGSASLILSGENAVGFSGIDASLSGSARITMSLTGKNAAGVDVSARPARLALADRASLTAYTTEETAECLRGEAAADFGAALLCGSLPEGGLTARSGDREIFAVSADHPGWSGELTLPQSNGSPYRSFLMLLPGKGNYEFTCAPDAVEMGPELTAQAAGVQAGAWKRELSFEVLSQLPGVTLESAAFVYDGTEKSLAVQDLPAGARVSYRNNSQKEPGAYPVTALVERAGFRSSTLARILTIQKRPLTVTAQAADKMVYDGSTSTTGTVTLGNAVSGDFPTATAVFTFDTADVGANKTVNVTEIRLVEDENNWAAHYFLERESTVAAAGIRHKKKVSLSFEESSLTQEYGSVTGVSATGSEEVRLRCRYGGAEKVPQVPGNYAVEVSVEDRNHFGNIHGIFRVLPKPITVLGISVPEISEGMKTLEIALQNISFDGAASGILDGDEVIISGTARYPDSTPGEKLVPVTGLTLSGAQAGCYELASGEAQGRGFVKGNSQSGGDPTPPGGEEPPEPDVPDVPDENPDPFWDIADHWAREDILAVAELGLMTGTEQEKFAPQEHMTRAMLMTVLCRMAGASPEEYTGSAYTDVAEGSWYAPYIQWATEEGMALGMENGTFQPNGSVSREQIAVFLYRFAQYRGLELAKSQELLFPDAETVSFWAVDGVRWAVEAGVLNGRDSGSLDPRGTATRAEVAAMLRRYLALEGPAQAE